jgi:hypothetical protein
MDESRQQAVIMGQGDTHIVLDGPSLRIKKRQLADQIIPLRRINQICSFGACKWETNALLACSDNNIAIHFCRQDGSIRAQLQPPLITSRHIPIQQLLEQNIKSYPTGQEFKQSLKNQCQIALNQALHNLAKQYGIRQPIEAKNLIDQIATEKINSYGWKKLKHIMLALIKSDVTGMLWRDSIQPDQVIFELHQIDLIGHLSTIIYCDIMPRILNQLSADKQSGRKIAISAANVVDLHQKQLAKIQLGYNQALLQVHRTLLEIKNDNP